MFPNILYYCSYSIFTIAWFLKTWKSVRRKMHTWDFVVRYLPGNNSSWWWIDFVSVIVTADFTQNRTFSYFKLWNYYHTIFCVHYLLNQIILAMQRKSKMYFCQYCVIILIFVFTKRLWDLHFQVLITSSFQMLSTQNLFK